MSYLVFIPDVSLRRLEQPYLYDRRSDELYELSDEAEAFLESAGGPDPPAAETADPDFVRYLVEEGLATLADRPSDRALRTQDASRRSMETPSLRYLELYLTERCNLQCRHCFLGDSGLTDLPLSAALSLLTAFEDMGGLRLLLTGGEALMHPSFWEINRVLPDFGFRSVLLSNGTLLEAYAPRLRVQEVQVSLDGLQPAHDSLRGEGTYARAMAGIEAALAQGLQVSVATMVTRLDRDDFPALAGLLRRLGVHAWNVDVPSPSGTLLLHPDLVLPPAEAAPVMDFGFGGGTHESIPGAVCGAHLMAVFADGVGAKCGFYHDAPVGRAEEGLDVLWSRVPRLPLSSLACNCAFVEECRGGCRFRAEATRGIQYEDSVQCHRYGVIPRTIGKGGGE